MKINNKPNFQFKKIKKYIFKGVLYKIVWKNKKFKSGHLGECEDPKTKSPEIRISPIACQDQKELLATLIDEITHAELFCIDNLDVDKLSDDLSDFLWEMGWRLPKKD